MVTDFHNHLIPQVDDGARTADETRAALHAMKAAGVGYVVTTPHLDASLARSDDSLQRRLAELDAGWAVLQDIARDVGGIHVGRGAEVRLDDPDPVLDDDRFRLDGTSFVLVEFSFFQIPPRSTRTLRRIREAGYIPVVAHPERYEDMVRHVDLATEWRRAGAYLQCNGGALTGQYGAEARRTIEILLARGLVDYLSSDYHARGPFRLQEYRSALGDAGADEQAQLLLEANPSRLTEAKPPLPVPPVRVSRSWIDRLRRRFGSRADSA